MKKPCLLPVALAVCGFFALSVGCTNDFDMIMSGNSSSDDEPIQISAPYAESDLQTLLFTDTSKSVTVDVSANTHLKELLLSLSYYETATPAPTQTAEYILEIGEVDLELYESGAVCLNTQTERFSVTASESLEYIQTLVAGEVTALDGYASAEKITAYDAGNKTCNVSENASLKTAFLENLQKVKLVKLSNGAHYALEKASYRIKIDEEELKIHEKFVWVGEELHFIQEGNFDFLKEYQYWLPWL